MPEKPELNFWRFYFRLISFKVKADDFAKSLGYRDAIAVPDSDRKEFITMFRERGYR